MRRRDLLTGAAASLALPRVAIGQTSDTLRFIPQTDLTFLDPHFTSAYATRNHGYMIFDTLYGQDGLYQTSPQMVAGDVVENGGLQWTLTLRDGMLWHDGTPVRARDCVASIRRWSVRDTFGQALMAVTDDLSAKDDKTIVFRLKKPFPLLRSALGKSSTYMPAMMPERLATTDPYIEVKEMVGSGPYQFVANERKLGSLVVYERFERYVPITTGTPDWTAGPKIVNFDRVEWHTIGDPAMAAEALKSGTMDWWDYVTPDQIHPLRRFRDTEVSLQDPTGQIAIMRVNHLYPPFDNPAIRRVLLSAVRQKEFMVAVAGTETSMWQTGVGVFCPGTTWDSGIGAARSQAKVDYVKVQKDLTAAGYSGQPVTVLAVTDLPVYRDLSATAIDTMKKMGFNVVAVEMTFRGVLERRSSRRPPDQGGWNVFFTAIAGTDILSPAGDLMLRSNGEDAWFGWPNSPRIERLRQTWLDAKDEPTQHRISESIERQFYIDVPYIPLGQYLQMTAYRTSLGGVLHGFALFWNVHNIS
jgi:peptide/nickel transport system substrate-binding protein